VGKYGGFKSEKRKKENARLKKQEEKRQRRFGLKTAEDAGEPGEVIEGQETSEEEDVTEEEDVAGAEGNVKTSP